MRARAKRATVGGRRTAKESGEATRRDVDVHQASNGKAAKVSPDLERLVVLDHRQENGTPYAGSEARGMICKPSLNHDEGCVFREVPDAVVGEKARR